MLLGLCGAPSEVRAALPTVEELYRGVTDCRFDLSHYADLPMEPYAQAVLINLPIGGAVGGIFVDTFYFVPPRDDQGEDYGIIFNAPLDTVAAKLPELMLRATRNGYLRRLVRLSDETGDSAARNKTLLHCTGGSAT